VEKAVGADRISEMSKKTGQSTAAVKEGLSSIIPEAVNKLTPDGKLPDPGDLIKMVKGLDPGKFLGS